MISFVIPSIGRNTIKYSIQSLLNQTIQDWKCVIGFDGIAEGDIDKGILVDDSRIEYLYLSEKMGQSAHHGNAGLVRNSIIEQLSDDTEWIGFLDDDDTLTRFYIEILELEKTKFKFDCCVFRMRYDKDNQKVIPPFGMNHLQQNYVGISFCVSKKFITENNIKFTNDNAEDFKFLKEIHDRGGRIHISSHITYNVNGHSYGQE
jgi:glycosyltransferase involved in cell wall biosynthesis